MAGQLLRSCQIFMKLYTVNKQISVRIRSPVCQVCIHYISRLVYIVSLLPGCCCCLYSEMLVSTNNFYKVAQYVNNTTPEQVASVQFFFQQQADDFVYENSPVSLIPSHYSSHIFFHYPWVSGPKIHSPLMSLLGFAQATSYLIRAAPVNGKVLLTSSLSLRFFDFFLFSALVPRCNYPVLWCLVSLLIDTYTHSFAGHNTARVARIIYM